MDKDRDAKPVYRLNWRVVALLFVVTWTFVVFLWMLYEVLFG